MGFVVACSNLGGLSGDDSGGASPDVVAPPSDDAPDDAFDAAPPVDRPDSGFLLSVSPEHIAEDPGDSFPVTITLNRAVTFDDAVTIAVNGLPTGAAVTPLVIPGGASTGTFSLSVGKGVTVPNADVTLTVVATNGSGGFTQTTPIVFRFGSLLEPSDGGVYVVPMSAKTLVVKAWGGGGGGGGINGSPGGGGGFVSGSIVVAPGETLIPDVATGGTDNGAGAGGGGLTGLRRGAIYLIVAGGGGGGGWSFNYAPQPPDRNGGGGGGQIGQDSPSVGGGGKGGSESASGAGGGGAFDAGAGSSLKGGNAANPYQPGGTPGGGFGGYDNSCSTGGGGGGAGWFGGGAGNQTCTLQGTGGGGGGSGYLEPTATNRLFASAIDVNCANKADPDYVAGVGTGGPGGPESKPNGGPGLLVVRLPKP
jgi:hypothetical protein